MNKIAQQAQQLPTLLQAASEHLTKMAEANVSLRDELDAAQHELYVVKIALRMEERQLNPSLSLQEKIAELQHTPPEKLAHVAAAIELASGGFSLGHLEEAESKVAGSTVSKSDEDPLGDYIMSQAALS